MHFSIPQLPHKLKPGDKVAVVAPAGPFDPVLLETGKAIWEARGFQVILPEHIFAREGYFAGNDQCRADVFNEALADPEIKALISARGGYGSLRIDEMVDYDALRKTPKLFLGFSDITVLLLKTWQECNLVTFSGPMIAGTQLGSLSVDGLNIYFNTLMSPNPPPPLTGENARFIRTGTAQGRLLGGNLTLLCTLAVAGQLPNLNGAVLLLEDINEPPYRIDRSLTALRRGGHLKNISGVACGSFGKNISEEQLDRLLLDCLGELEVPILVGLPVGHDGLNRLVPLGVEVAFSQDRPALTFQQSGVC